MSRKPEYGVMKMKRLRWSSLIVLVALLALAGPAHGQDKPAESAEPNAIGFKASDEVPKENLPGWPFLYGAYFLLWLIPFAYLVVIWRRQAALDDQLKQLDNKLDALDAAAGE